MDFDQMQTKYGCIKTDYIPQRRSAIKHFAILYKDALKKKIVSYNISEEQKEEFKKTCMLECEKTASNGESEAKINIPSGFPMNIKFYEELFPDFDMRLDINCYLYLSGWEK